MSVEFLLKLLVSVVDAELLERVLLCRDGNDVSDSGVVSYEQSATY